MERWLGRYSDGIYGIMRRVVGFLFACHGAQKLFGAHAPNGFWPIVNHGEPAGPGRLSVESLLKRKSL